MLFVRRIGGVGLGRAMGYSGLEDGLMSDEFGR